MRPVSTHGRITRLAEISASADLHVQRRRHHVGERPLGFDGLGRILSMVRKIVDRPTPNSSASSAWV